MCKCHWVKNRRAEAARRRRSWVRVVCWRIWQKDNHTFTYIGMANSESQSNLTSLPFHCGKKQEYLEKTHKATIKHRNSKGKPRKPESSNQEPSQVSLGHDLWVSNDTCFTKLHNDFNVCFTRKIITQFSELYQFQTYDLQICYNRGKNYSNRVT